MLLHEVASRVRKYRNLQAIGSHHGLIKLVVIKELTQLQLNWDNFISSDALPWEGIPENTPILRKNVKPWR